MNTSPPPAIDPLAQFSGGGTSAGSLNEDRACVQCGYNLRGLSVSGKCSECGTPVELSLRGFLLQYSSPAYLALINSGLSLVLNGILLLIVVNVGSAFVGVAAASGMGGGSALPLLLAGVGLLPSIMILFGYWRFTAPDPAFVGTELPSSARQVIRVTVIIQAATSALTFAMQLIGMQGGMLGPSVEMTVVLALTVIATIAWVVQIFAALRYTRWVASRIPDAKVVSQTRTYMWLLPLLSTVGMAVIIGPLVALVLYWNMLDRVRKHVKAIRETGSPAPLRGAAA